MAERNEGKKMVFIRLVLPATIITSGLVLAAVTRSQAGYEGGALLISAGLSVWLLNLVFRIGVDGDQERDSEEEARSYYNKYGRWPDE